MDAKDMIRFGARIVDNPVEKNLGSCISLVGCMTRDPQIDAGPNRITGKMAGLVQ